MKIGMDLVEIPRIERSIKNPKFLKRVYSPKELDFLKKAENYAGNFAAKEAFAKAVGTGFRGFSLNEISVLRNNVGKPYITLSGNALVLFSEQTNNISVTITHSRNTAAAVVIIE